MANVATQSAVAVPISKDERIMQILKARKDSMHEQKTDIASFEPSKHLAYTAPTEVVMMKDLGFPESIGVSPVAVSQPFQLFSEEAVHTMRSEVFELEVLENCFYSSNIAPCQVRGYAPRYAPFTYEAWTNAETLAILSKIAGVDLVPVMDFEIGHINISSKSEEQARQELDAISKQKNFFAEDEGIGGCPWEDDKPIVGWHTDSYPFVCVTMLSDCTNMVGGETALRTADGNVLKVRGPGMGCAVVLQGRYITHQALRALGAQERITSVTSFRPRSPHLPDDSELRTVRPISDLSELYYGFGEYRLEMLQERIQARLKALRTDRRVGRRFKTASFKSFLQEQENFLKHTDTELVQDEEVVRGYIEELTFPDVDIEGDDQSSAVNKRARIE